MEIAEPRRAIAASVDAMADRTVTLALVNSSGVPVGTLALPGSMPLPYWQEVGEAVDAARDVYGIEVTILRMFSVVPPIQPGNAVTYVAEYDGPLPDAVDTSAADQAWTAPHPKRMPWAKPGGPAASLAWADRELAARGWTVLRRTQVRAWHLSSFWRLETDHGRVWLKEVPWFCAYEGAVLRWLGRPTTPVVLATSGGRTLMADIPGTDRYEADTEERGRMLAELLDIQTAALDRIDELLALGVRDLRAEAFTAAAVLLASEIDVPGFDEMVADLPKLFAAIAECGVPDTLVHGDFHPGNVRSDGTSMVIIDWGECVIGNPALDLIRMRDFQTKQPSSLLVGQWCDHWSRVVPGCDPRRALSQMVVVQALHEALSYGGFVRSIEPAERPFHEQDVIDAARRAVARHQTHKDQLKTR